jgi:hypothetical protein
MRSPKMSNASAHRPGVKGVQIETVTLALGSCGADGWMPRGHTRGLRETTNAKKRTTNAPPETAALAHVEESS